MVVFHAWIGWGEPPRARLQIRRGDTIAVNLNPAVFYPPG